MQKKERFKRVLEYFAEAMPLAETELRYTTPYELMVAVILSAQCTDKRVNMITPEFFKAFPTVFELANAGYDQVFSLINSCSYPNNKTRHLLGMAGILVNRFGGTVPDTLEELLEIPGVGRKTANVILAVAYRKPAMAVDTHVFRVSARIGLTSRAKNPLEAEQQLVKYIPSELIHIAHHWLILHGRYICKARKPLCDRCGLTELCLYFQQEIRK